MNIRIENESSNKYSHPFKPYDIQVKLMDAIYDAIENYKVGLFESPTGTGKTLSLICASMTWLRKFKKENPSFAQNEDIATEDSSDDEPEWVKKAYEESIMKNKDRQAFEYERRLEELEKSYKTNLVLGLNNDSKRAKVSSLKSPSEEDEFIPDDYYSDSENGVMTNDRHKLALEVKQLLERLEDRENSAESNACPVKIFYSSRTHSQLNQFAHQLNLTRFESSIRNISERTKFTPLASRKQLCINTKVSALNDPSSINDACKDLQQSSDKGCDFIPKLHNQSSLSVVSRFSDLSLTKIHDIEDLTTLGKALYICPYYSIRNSLPAAEVVTLPYQMLLEKTVRKSLNLSVDNSIVIIDEAHNLLDVISAMYSVSISLSEISEIIDSLNFYLRKFIKRLNTGNRVHIMKLIKICLTIDKFIKNRAQANDIKNGEEIEVNEIFSENTGDLVNIHKIETYLSESRIAYKIENYRKKVRNGELSRDSANPLLFKIAKFLKCLSNPSKEGKLIWDMKSAVPSINYMLLDPSEVFKDIVERARCVILCGGTMEPFSDFTNYLFPYVPQNQIKSFSCGHIIAKDNLKVFCIDHYKSSSFEFQFDKRNDEKMIENLGFAISEILGTIPHGAVLFFPSYNYMDLVHSIWKKKGILAIIERKKKIFMESSGHSNADFLLQKYSRKIQEENDGALLFSVVGGKMSEGINFSDSLARAVFVIGLPFPNAFASELIAKRKHIEKKVLQRGGSRSTAAQASRDFYENICMRAVNQSVGRSVRNSSDYALIYLIDKRYLSSHVQDKLSSWVRERLQFKSKSASFAEIVSQSKKFFYNRT